MAKIEGRPSIQAQIVIVLNEEEAAALDALAGYGTRAFLDGFYTLMGRSYLQPHEDGLSSLFESVRNGPASVRSILDKSRDARKVFNATHVATEKPRDI